LTESVRGTGEFCKTEMQDLIYKILRGHGFFT